MKRPKTKYAPLDEIALSRTDWERLLLNWSNMAPTGEVRLVCAVLADGIVDRQKDPRFFAGGGFDAYCRVIGLDPVFVREQIGVADSTQALERVNAELARQAAEAKDRRHTNT